MEKTRRRAGIFNLVLGAWVLASVPVEATTGHWRHRQREPFSLTTPISEEKLKFVPEMETVAIRRRFVTAEPLQLVSQRRGEHRLRGRQRLRIGLFDGESVDARLTRVIEHRDSRAGDSFTWFGFIPGRDIGDVILTVVDGVMMGTVYDQDRVYLLRALTERNVFELSELDLLQLPVEDDVEVAADSLNDIYAGDEARRRRIRRRRVHPANVFRQIGSPLTREAIGEEGLTYLVDSGARIDLLMAYTKEASEHAMQLRNANGDIVDGVTNIDLLIAHAVDKSNYVVLLSGIPTYFNVVKTLLLKAPEPSLSAQGMIDTITTGGQYNDEVLVAADQYRADLTSLFVVGKESWSECGKGSSLNELVEPAEQEFYLGRGKQSAFSKSMVRTRCALFGLTLVHELGHNLGLKHDHYVNTSGNGPTGIGFGFVLAPVRRRTIMAYNDLCVDFFDANCKQLPRFSDPLASFQGFPMGVYGGGFIDPANSVDAAIAALWTVANFRPSAFPPP